MTDFDFSSIDITIGGLQQHYRNGDVSVRELIFAQRQKALALKDNPIWIYLLDEEELEDYIQALDNTQPDQLPLYGIPFAVKDNIDLAGVPTTAACPAFKYTPEKSATVVKLLIEAGAIPMGKTNMDQFATGLVGTRSPKPWGPCKNAFDESAISGGSSSGSAIALAKGQVSFSLGTDTAGSGRVPASLNNLVGLKPSRGLLSNTGLVPACRSLDCISIFALNTNDANSVLDIAGQYDAEDAYSRKNSYANGKRYYAAADTNTVIGIPSKDSLEFFGNAEAQTLFTDFINTLPAANITLKEIDLTPFINAAQLLYQGPWVAERWLATQPLIIDSPEKLLPVIQTIIGAGASPSAADGFAANYKLQAFKQLADTQLASVDAILTPTNPSYFSIAEVEQNPVELNSKMGYYTNFMNLLDYSALALPIGFFNTGVGYGCTLFSKAFNDKKLLAIGAKLQNLLQLPTGAFSGAFKPQGKSAGLAPSNTIDVVVCGAHLEGLPLNWQLTERGGERIRTTTTSAHYRFYALNSGPPLRPGLVRRENEGRKIAVEVWRVPATSFGSFVNEISAPLGIGKIELTDGSWLSGFTCDTWGLVGATDITDIADWRKYLAGL